MEPSAGIGPKPAFPSGHLPSWYPLADMTHRRLGNICNERSAVRSVATNGRLLVIRVSGVLLSCRYTARAVRRTSRPSLLFQAHTSFICGWPHNKFTKRPP